MHSSRLISTFSDQGTVRLASLWRRLPGDLFLGIALAGLASTGCKSDGECLTNVCGRCPGVDDACASQICVDGQCTFSCPTDACGGCEAPQICVYQAGGPGPGHYACAEQLPCGAAGACACIVDQGTCESEKVDGYCTCDNGLE